MIESEAAARAWLAEQDWCSREALERLETLVAMLCEENARQNLVSRASLSEAWRRHIADSAQLLTHVPRETRSWLDLGSGAGFPGLVIAALCPDLPVSMVESRARRIEWLENARQALDLKQATVVGQTLERFDSAKFGIISARAFAPLEKLLSLSARFSTSATVWLLPKGRSAQQELDSLAGWRHTFHVEQSLTDRDSGVIVGTLTGKKGNSQ